MPYVEIGNVAPGGGGAGRTLSIVSVQSVATDATGATVVSEQARSVQEAVVEAGQAVKVLPPATAPRVANLPSTAKPGEMYSFAANPAAIYVYGSDNIWRALLLVTVV